MIPPVVIVFYSILPLKVKQNNRIRVFWLSRN